MTGDARQVPRPGIFASEAPGEERAFSEKHAVELGNLERSTKRNEHRRRERLRDWLAAGVPGLIVLMAAITALAIMALGWHYLAPAVWAWLSEGQLKAVRTFIFSGAVISAVSTHVTRHV